MKRGLDWIALLMLVLLAGLVVTAFFGPLAVGSAIATQTDLAGHGPRYGSRWELCLMPALGLLIFAVLKGVGRYPANFSYPVKATQTNRAQLEEVAQSLLAWVRVEVLVLFVLAEAAMLNGVRGGVYGMAVSVSIAAMVGAVLATVGWHVTRMVRLDSV